ncbi:cold-inducible RNA-binding protein, putative [Entamoeba dispar SAW760]|uniref:Cold-inducible RNA-binding protein, putative n=1 Tax=Entamoeba dispar (strain ATCC PRA-260 / SAW760) TaxID=370354 RepID=B0EEA3_ENTDS|nr:cold-inducible RNA-binding protein, putative [Entamoeba dispar SAW760]EDR27150.1 cold-inducible RNA-binding protein, putative [Entamoeba dispar SAW760]|eukprot:EDR27150.1 cold-inducible RNA-binding protein, putative [Entamoeba dispar SAW760]
MTRLYIGSLAYSVTDESLRAAFEKFGTVTDCKVVTDRESQRSKGFGFVTFEKDEDAKKAIEEMNEQELEGRRIKVDVSKPREEGRRRDYRHDDRDSRRDYRSRDDHYRRDYHHDDRRDRDSHRDERRDSHRDNDKNYD